MTLESAINLYRFTLRSSPLYPAYNDKAINNMPGVIKIIDAK